MAGAHELIGIMAAVGDPLWVSARRARIATLLDELGAYTHTKTVGVGYDRATITFACSQVDAEDWLEHGLGRDITVYDEALVEKWNGFVNEVRINLGALGATRGPLLSVCNRAMVAYTPYVDITTDPPLTGTPTVTVLADDTDSQALYAILEDVVSGGTLMDDATVTGGTASNEAEEVRDAYLEEMKDPETGSEYALGSTGSPSVTLELLGYGHFLAKYVYTDETTGYTTATDKLEAVLAADPNSIFSTDYTNVDDNAALVENQEITNRTARVIIDEIIAQGGASDERWLFGISAMRMAKFNAIPTAVKYKTYLSGQAQQIETMNGIIVRPWDMDCGEWLYFADFLAGREQDTVLRLDPRNMFIESVTYSTAFGLSLQGGKVGTFAQKMAKKGLVSG